MLVILNAMLLWSRCCSTVQLLRAEQQRNVDSNMLVP